jgi:hypothetical protein
LLGHTSKENITKHFENCITLEAEVPCSPCFSLIYDHDKQKCPIDEVTGAVACMGGGIDPMVIYRIIEKKYTQWNNFNNNGILGGLCYGNKNFHTR